jgi:hypothetical protein
MCVCTWNKKCRLIEELQFPSKFTSHASKKLGWPLNFRAQARLGVNIYVRLGLKRVSYFGEFSTRLRLLNFF